MSYVDGSTCGWHGTINAFLQTSEHDWLRSLQHHHLACMNEQANASQVKAWEQSSAMSRCLTFGEHKALVSQRR